MRTYYRDTPKPLAVYRDRLRWDDPAEARKDFYGTIRLRWRHRMDLYKRHEHRIVTLALSEWKRSGGTA